jgi:hypothetical protein
MFSVSVVRRQFIFNSRLINLNDSVRFKLIHLQRKEMDLIPRITKKTNKRLVFSLYNFITITAYVFFFVYLKMLYHFSVYSITQAAYTWFQNIVLRICYVLKLILRLML